MKYFTRIVVLGLLVWLAGCQPAAGGTEAALVVSEVWGRPSPAMAAAAAFYMEIANSTATMEQLTAVSSPACHMSEIHETAVDADGVMHMNPVGTLEIPPQATVSLAPGGLHIMCMGLMQPLTPGDDVTLTLTFANAGEITAVAVIKEE